MSWELAAAAAELCVVGVTEVLLAGLMIDAVAGVSDAGALAEYVVGIVLLMSAAVEGAVVGTALLLKLRLQLVVVMDSDDQVYVGRISEKVDSVDRTMVSLAETAEEADAAAVELAAYVDVDQVLSGPWLVKDVVVEDSEKVNAGWLAGNVDSVDKTMVSLTDADDAAAADDFGASAEYVEKVLAALLLRVKEVVAVEDSV